MNLGRYGLGGEIINCTFYDYSTNKPFLYMDYANSTENSWTADQTYATGGKGAPRRIVFNSAKQSTLVLESQIFSMQHLAMVAGKSIESGIGKEIYKREVLTVVDNVGSMEITLSKEPVDINGDSTVDGSDVAVFEYSNGIDGSEVTVTSVTGSVVVLDGVAAGDNVAVYYRWNTTAEAHKLTFTSTDFPNYVKIIGDTMLTDEVAGDLVSGQLVYYKAKLNPEFTLTAANSGDPTSITFTFDIFATDIAGESVMADVTLYDE